MLGFILWIPCVFAADNPLLLTPYINSINTSEAQKLAKVEGLPVDILSYSGFLNVNPDYNSNLFFWFFPAEYKPEDAPVVLWLLGGPGSSTHSLFNENGPIEVDEVGNIRRRTFTWTSACNMLYIDAPAGAGFSFTDNPLGYSKNQTDVAEDLYNAVGQFFDLFTEYKQNEFYVMGESYAGKYATALSYRIFQDNNSTINYRGMAIGSGWLDPINMMGHGTHLYNMGLLDAKESADFSAEESKIQELIDNEKWTEALTAFYDLLDNYRNLTGFETYDSFMNTKPKWTTTYNENFLQKPQIRDAIHVGQLPFNDSSIVDSHLRSDIMQSVKPWIEELLNNDYRIMFYSGQMDMIAAHTLTQNLINDLDWNGAGEYNETSKKIWRVDDDVAGYVKQARNFTYAIVRNAGHLVAQDQPNFVYDLIRRFLTGEDF